MSSAGGGDVPPLEEQIRVAMRRAMKDMILSVAQKEEGVTEDEADWLGSLLTELVRRLNALVPRRTDLHRELAAACDVQLLRQMLLHRAIDSSDGLALVAAVCTRLRLLCAPVQDLEVAALERRVGETANVAEGLAELLDGADAIVTEIERLDSEIRQRLVPEETHESS